MLTTPFPVPPNSTSPLPADWAQNNANSMYALFSAGLMREPQVACAPGPSAFADLAPAGTLFPVVISNDQYPALSTASLQPAPVSPLSAQVYQVQQMMAQGLTTNNGQLTAAVEATGQQGANGGSASDAAEVYPMATTANMILERTPFNQRGRRKGPPRPAITETPGAPWGGAAQRVPGGGCSGSVSGWGKLFFLAGAGAILLALLSE